MAEKTRRQIENTFNEVLDTYLGPLHGEVYITALDIFPDFRKLRELRLLIEDRNDAEFPFYISNDEQPTIVINRSFQLLSTGMRARISKRFEISSDLTEELPASALTQLILAHELGHAIQRDERFPYYFFEDRLGVAPDPRIDYEGYINSDRETNADYIAQCIIANTKYGELFGINLPQETPREWRSWVTKHKIF